MLTASYLFHNIIVRFHAFGSSLFFESWDERLDPFQVSLPSNEKAALVIKNTLGAKLGDKWTHISQLGTGFFHMEVFQNPLGDTLWEDTWTSKQSVLARLWMNHDFTEIHLVADNSNSGGNLPDICLGYLMPSVMLKHNAITLHGVLLEHEGRGIIVSAPSGIGKTTHARFWRDHKRALILNGDRATCCVEDGKWIGFSLPWSGTSGECINRDVPLTAFVMLEQSLENRVERLFGLSAFEAIMPNLRYPTWDRELTEKALDFIDDFLEKVPVFRLRCRPDVDAVETLDRALREL